MGTVISGTLTLDKKELRAIDDHYSLMHHFQREVTSKWKIKDEEFFDMLEEYLAERKA